MSNEQVESVSENAGQELLPPPPTLLQQPGEINGKAKNDSIASKKERPHKRGGGGGRYEPYGNVNRRYRVFVSNIPYDVKWQALKDLMKEKGATLTSKCYLGRAPYCAKQPCAGDFSGVQVYKMKQLLTYCPCL